MGVPGYSRKHGYTHIALGSWECGGKVTGALELWKSPTKYVQTLGSDDEAGRRAIKQAYAGSGIRVLANV